MVGKRISSYLINEEVGAGNLGITYFANDEQTQQTVALKIVHPQFASQSVFREKFLASTDILQGLRHRSIAQVYDLGESDGYLFIASERVKGESLHQFLQREPQVSLGMGARLMQQVAEAVAFAQRQGIVHGGLHPGNILLLPYGGDLPWRPIVTDFRQASLIPGDPPTALLPYLSPEQCDGKRPNGRSDVYAIGIILYQLATGRLPYEPQTVRDALAGGIPPALRSIRPDIPSTYAAFIEKAMARSTVDRYRSMEEMLLFLRREASQLSLTSQPGKPVEVTPVSVAPVIQEPSPAPIVEPAPLPVNQEADVDLLHIAHPRMDEQTFPLDKWMITLGQREDNDLVLKGDGVAPKHARLERTDTGWNIFDMGSLEGTRLENSPLLADVAEAWKPGHVVYIGEYELTWEPHEQPEPEIVPLPVASVPQPDGQLYLYLTQIHTDVEAGYPAQAILEVENQTGESIHIHFVIEGVPTSWVVIEHNPLRLAAQQKAIVPFTVQPPRNSQAGVGLQSFQVTAKPDNARVSAASANGHLNIRPFKRFFSELTPGTLQHQQQGEILLHNIGNVPSQYILNATDVENQIAFEFVPRETTITPGQVQTIQIVGRGQKQPWVLRKKLVSFDLTISNGTMQSKQPGRLVIPPKISLPMLLLAGIPLLLILLFGYVYVLFAISDPCNGFVDESISSGCDDSLLTETVAPAVVPTKVEVAVPAVVSATATAVPEEPAPESTATQLPAASEEIIIGQSAAGEDIIALKYGNGSKSFLFVGGLYAGFSPASIDLAKRIRNYYAAHPEVIPENAALYFVPEWNPDSHAGNGRLNGDGVDLNKNWPCNWEETDDGRAGFEPLSAPESQALHTFITDINPEVVVIWNTPTQQENYGFVSPGRCTRSQTDASTELADLYTIETEGYLTGQVDESQRLSGDITDSIADMGIPSVFVLLNDKESVDPDEHIPAVQNIIDTYSAE